MNFIWTRTWEGHFDKKRLWKSGESVTQISEYVDHIETSGIRWPGMGGEEKSFFGSCEELKTEQGVCHRKWGSEFGIAKKAPEEDGVKPGIVS